MKTTDPFNSIGKRIPYTVPDHFFEKLQQNVWDEVAATTAKETSSPTEDEKNIPLKTPAGQRHNKVLRWMTIALPAAAVMTGLAILPFHNTPKSHYPSTSQNLNTTEWIEQLSDEELESYCLFMDNDIFMEQQNTISDF